MNRGGIREVKKIDGYFIGDCLCEWLCGPCSVT